MTSADWALFWLNAHDRQTEGFTRPLESYTAEDLNRMSYVSDWLLDVLPKMMNRIIHPRLTPKLKNAIAYLTALHEMQNEVMRPLFEKIAKETRVDSLLKEGRISEKQYLEYILKNG